MPFWLRLLNWELYYCCPYVGETACLKKNLIQRKVEPRDGESPCPDDTGARNHQRLQGALQEKFVSLLSLLLLMPVRVGVLALVTEDVVTPKG